MSLAQGALSHSPVAPNGAYVLFERCPTADAMGYGLSPLRGFSKCRFAPGTRTPENGQSPADAALRRPRAFQARHEPRSAAALSACWTRAGLSQRDNLYQQLRNVPRIPGINAATLTHPNSGHSLRTRRDEISAGAAQQIPLPTLKK